MRAAIAAGATLDELKRWLEGEYPPWFMGHVVAAYRAEMAITNHAEDAKATALEKRARRQNRRKR